MFRSSLLYSSLFISSLTIISSVVAGDRSDFEKWMNQETENYQEYRDKRDKEFTGFLKSQWKEMQTFQGMVRDKTPKPVKMPVVTLPPVVVKPRPPQADKKPEVIKAPVVIVPVIKPVPIPVVIKPEVIKKPDEGKALVFNYFGQKLQFSYDPKLKVRLSTGLNEKEMSRYWSELSKAKYESLLEQINAQRKPLNLNDWGYALLINEVAKGINPGQNSKQALLTWFMLTKAGYQARIAYDANQVFLLLPSKQQLFAAPYFTFDKVRYYALGFDGEKQKLGKVFTYDGQYPGATKRLDMRLNKALNTGRNENHKSLAFSFSGKKYSIKINNDKETIDFLKTYPQMDIGMYFNSTVNQTTGNPILMQLKPLVDGKSELEAVNLLLRFVQTSLKYKTDEGQFGIENYLFPEETIFYPYSDCEDRSIFFAWLVRNLLGLEVVGLDYPGHIAAAVRFNEKVKGDAFRMNGKRYVVTDPTYINASAGMSMPDFKKSKPGIIRISF